MWMYFPGRACLTRRTAILGVYQDFSATVQFIASASTLHLLLQGRPKSDDKFTLPQKFNSHERGSSQYQQKNKDIPTRTYTAELTSCTMHRHVARCIVTCLTMKQHAAALDALHIASNC